MKALSRDIFIEMRKQLSIEKVTLFVVVTNILLFIGVTAMNQYSHLRTNIEQRAEKERVQKIVDAPAKDFFFYYDVVPTKDEFQLGETLSFFSFNDTYQSVRYMWNDRLLCDLDDDDKGYHLVSAHIDSAPRSEPSKANYANPTGWDFIGKKPEATGVCYVQHIIEAEVEEGVTKEQIVIGKEFHIVE